MKTFAKPCVLCKKLCQVPKKWWKGQRAGFRRSGLWAVRFGKVTENEDGTLLRYFRRNRPCILCGCDREEASTLWNNYRRVR